MTIWTDRNQIRNWINRIFFSDTRKINFVMYMNEFFAYGTKFLLKVKIAYLAI